MSHQPRALMANQSEILARADELASPKADPQSSAIVGAQALHEARKITFSVENMANLPTMAQPATPLSQLSELSGAASGLGQLATMAGQQAQMISALAQQSTQQHTTLTHQVTPDDDTPGADAGTANGQRAPIDTATSPSQPGQQRVP